MRCNRQGFSFVYFGLIACLSIFAGQGQLSAASSKSQWLDELKLDKMTAGWGAPIAKRSIQDKPLTLGGQVYEHGIGSHAHSEWTLQLDGKASRFKAIVGVDSETAGRGSVVFIVIGDKHKLFESGTIKGSDPAQSIDLDLTGIKTLRLIATGADDGIDYDHANWAMARIDYNGKPPVAIDPVHPEPYILTPKPGPSPKINGPLVFGARPGNPFIYRIPATGNRPMQFGAEQLPPSLKLDAKTGIITGNSPAERGEYPVVLTAKNEQGTDRRPLNLMVGDTLALTPPMGWNDWYIHYNRITDADMRASADQMIDTGMADYGYMYVNIDDCWSKKNQDEPYRDDCGRILPSTKFPDMRALTDYIHSKGLRAGIYTSPGPWNCAGYTGSYGHEQLDAQQFAEWGFDFLKYDWCSYGRYARGKSRYEYVKPYALMGEILKNLDRDIVYNLCQYGMDSVWEWGESVNGNCWRTTGDLGLSSSFMDIGLSNARHDQYAGPGHWNDPDYILIGWVGNAHGMGEGKPTHLSPDQQYQYMSMWCLMAAPLIFSGDMTKLDDFTLNILCNAEVIDIDQDPLGVQGKIVRQDVKHFVMIKPLQDGSKAIGIFNLQGYEALEVSLPWSEVDLETPRRIRDPWRQKDLARSEIKSTYQVTLPEYGVRLLRLYY